MIYDKSSTQRAVTTKLELITILSIGMETFNSFAIDNNNPRNKENYMFSFTSFPIYLFLYC